MGQFNTLAFLADITSFLWPVAAAAGALFSAKKAFLIFFDSPYPAIWELAARNPVTVVKNAGKQSNSASHPSADADCCKQLRSGYVCLGRVFVSALSGIIPVRC